MGGHASRQKYNLLKMNCFCSVQTVNRSMSAFYDTLLSIIMLLNIFHIGTLDIGILCVWNIFGKCGSHSIYFVIINQLRIRMDIWGLLYCVPLWRTVSLSYYLNLHLELSIVSSQWGNSILFLQTAPAWEDVWFRDAGRTRKRIVQRYNSISLIKTKVITPINPLIGIAARI